MTQWAVMYRKEMLEMWRGFKWLWLPLVFVLLGAMQPIATYYMSQILELAGGLPEGTVIEIPVPTGGQMMAEVFGQFGTIGVLVLVLAGMGVVAGEKSSRAISLILVRPVPYSRFVMAKWTALLTLGTASLVAGSLAGWYYTELLIGAVPAGDWLASTALYACWLIFVMTVTLWASTLLKGSSGIAFVTILIAIALTMATGLLGDWLAWSPSRPAALAAELLAGGEIGAGGSPAVAIAGTLAAIGLLLAWAIIALKKQELAD